MLTPFSEAMKHFDEDTFYTNIVQAAGIGFLHSDSDCFVAAELVHHSIIKIKSKYGIKIKSQLELDKPDTWLIYMVAGDIKYAFNIIKPAKYLAFERLDDKLRLYDFSRVRRLLWAIEKNGNGPEAMQPEI